MRHGWEGGEFGSTKETWDGPMTSPAGRGGLYAAAFLLAGLIPLLCRDKERGKRGMVGVRGDLPNNGIIAMTNGCPRIPCVRTDEFLTSCGLLIFFKKRGRGRNARARESEK